MATVTYEKVVPDESGFHPDGKPIPFNLWDTVVLRDDNGNVQGATYFSAELVTIGIAGTETDKSINVWAYPNVPTGAYGQSRFGHPEVFELRPAEKVGIILGTEVVQVSYVR